MIINLAEVIESTNEANYSELNGTPSNNSIISNDLSLEIDFGT